MFTGPVGEDEAGAQGHEEGLLLCNEAASVHGAARGESFKRLLDHVVGSCETQTRYFHSVPLYSQLLEQ